MSARHSPIPLALLRIGVGACLTWDVVDLMRWSGYWFEGAPYPAMPLLALWCLATVGLTLGVITRACAVANYLACVWFLGIEALARGYEYHLDNLYLLISLGLVVLPAGRALSIDARRRPPEESTVGQGPFVFVALVVSAIYFDSAVWKLSSRMWIAGLGVWTPITFPWDGTPHLAWTTEHAWLVRALGYGTLAFELLFPALIWKRRLRWALITIGILFHAGIGFLLPLPRFGALMIVLLVALAPIGPVRVRSHRERTPPRPFMAAALTGWALAFLLCLSEGAHVLVTRGLGGVSGVTPRAWFLEAQAPLGPALTRASSWSYRLFGQRSHPIFLDSAFAPYHVQTRLAVRVDDEVRRLHAPVRNREWLAWNFRIAWPRHGREVMTRKLLRFARHHPAAGQVIVQQRPIRVPTDRWRAGQRERNGAADWTTVAEISGDQLRWLVEPPAPPQIDHQ